MGAMGSSWSGPKFVLPPVKGPTMALTACEMESGGCSIGVTNGNIDFFPRDDDDELQALGTARPRSSAQ